MSTIEDRIQAADKRAAKAQAYRGQLQRIAVAEAEVPNAYRTGEVSKSKLAEQYGISTMTVGRILAEAGIAGTTQRRLNEEERREVAGMIKAGENLDQIAAAYGVSRNSIRTVGLKQGVLQPGERKPHRTAEEYALIEAFDQEARARFGGAGLFNLGTGLRNWHAKQRREGANPNGDAAQAHGDVPTPQTPSAMPASATPEVGSMQQDSAPVVPTQADTPADEYRI